MKKQAIIINFIIIFLIANIGDLRCQENSNMINTQYQSKYIEKMTKEDKEDGLEDDKNVVVEILGMLIKRNLLYEYQQINSEELEARLERSR